MGWEQIPGVGVDPWDEEQILDARGSTVHGSKPKTGAEHFFQVLPLTGSFTKLPGHPALLRASVSQTHQYNINLFWHGVPPSLVARRETEFPRGFADVQGMERRVAGASTNPRGPQGGAPAIRRRGNARFSHCAGLLPAAEQELLGPWELLKRLGVIWLGRGKPKGVSRRGLSGVFGSPPSPAHVPKAVWLPPPMSPQRLQNLSNFLEGSPEMLGQDFGGKEAELCLGTGTTHPGAPSATARSEAGLFPVSALSTGRADPTFH